MPGPGGRSAPGHRQGTGTGGLAQGGGGGGGGLSKLTACFRPAPHPSVIFDLQLSSLVAAYNRLPSFLDASIALLEACLSDGSVRADQLFQSAGPDRVPESALQELVNYLEEAGEAGVTVQSLSFYGCQAVSAFLLRFLDNIPEPLLTYAKYDQFLKAANMDPHAVGPGSNAGFRAAFPACVALAAGAGARSGAAAAAAALDADDQMLVMQSLLISLPGAHYMLLQRMLQLFRRMLDAAAAASPRARGQHHFHQAQPSPAAGLSSPTSVSLQRLSLLFCSTFLSPLHLPGYNAAASLDAALRKAQEQQVLVYLVQHYDDLFHRHPVRLLHAQPPPVAPVVHDPNEKLLRAVQLWRNKSHQMTVNFGRRHFDIKAIVRAFRAWKGLSKTNRRVSGTKIAAEAAAATMRTCRALPSPVRCSLSLLCAHCMCACLCPPPLLATYREPRRIASWHCSNRNCWRRSTKMVRGRGQAAGRWARMQRLCGIRSHGPPPQPAHSSHRYLFAVAVCAFYCRPPAVLASTAEQRVVRPEGRI